MKRKPESGGDCIDDEESQEPTMRSTSPAAKPKKKNRKNAGVEDKDRRRSAGEPEYYNEDEVEEHFPIVESGGDICRALMERYARSTAPQHRHLCATAAAMRSILSEEGIPLIPPAYFAAAITAFQDADRSDREGVAALSAFLAVVLQHATTESLSKAKAKDAAFVIASFVRDSVDCLSTGTLRSLVKSLGQVALMMDLEDWPSIELTFHTLLLFAVDKRPKVRRSAQSGLEILFKYCHDSSIVEKASKVVYRMHRKYIASIKILSSIELTDATLNNNLSKPEHLEAIHVLNVLNAILPYLSDKVRIEVLSDTHKLLGCHFSWPTRHILRILEVLLEHLDIKALVAQAENIISAVTSYVVTAEKNPVDTIVSASLLLKNLLKKLGDELPSMWTRYLPITFTSLIGYLGSDSDASKNVADILKEFINFHIKQNLFISDKGQLRRYEMDSCPEAAAVSSICKVLDKMLKKCSFPTEFMLEVISVLFLKLGGSSYFFMKKTLIILSKFAQNEDAKSNIPHVEQCIGTAVIAMGPEKLLSLIPIAVDIKKLTFSNSWIIPILKKYVVGASLQYFIDNIVPLAKCIQEAYKNDNKEFIQKSLLSYFSSLWDLLPAFCRYPTDISVKFESLSMLLVVVLKEEPSLHESIALALQILVYSNREDSRHCVDDPSSIFSQKFNMEFIKFCYPKKVACKNMKALASRSVELFQILKEVFFEYPDRRGCIKDALGSLGFIIPSEYIKSFFLSAFKTFEQSSSLTESESIYDHAQLENKKDGDAKAGFEKNEQSCLLMELASSFVEAADTDLTHIIFDFIKYSLLNTNPVFQSEAYFTLNRILKEKDSYSCAQLDVLIELLFTVKPPVDASTLKTRFSCFDYLLVYMLKSNVADMNIKAFFILNEIILTLKSKKESRKLAYDSLLNISIKLKTLQPDCTDSNILHLFTMVMGYLSSSSPHIMSGAVSALSLLIYHDATFCLSVPNLIPSVLVLLQNKSNEVIKAALGFIKVLVSSLKCNDLRKLLPEILQGVLPWSLVSKHHFRSKVGIILEILIRKCGSESVECQTTDKYKGFVKSIKEGRANRKLTKGVNDSESADLIADRAKKRQRDDEKFSKFKSKHERIGKKPNNSFSINQNSARATKKWLRNPASNQRRKYPKKQGSGVDSNGTNRPKADKSRYNKRSRGKI